MDTERFNAQLSVARVVHKTHHSERCIFTQIYNISETLAENFQNIKLQNKKGI